MTNCSHALSRLIVDTTCMFPRLKPGDELILKHFCPVHDDLVKGDDIACATSDGRMILAQFCQHTARGLLVRQLARETALHIDHCREPILYRITAISHPKNATLRPAKRLGA